jgi:Flp pilus assembly pilin Flp
MAAQFQKLRRWCRETRGATMAEYAMLIAVIALVVVIGARALGTSASGKLDNAASQIG